MCTSSMYLIALEASRSSGMQRIRLYTKTYAIFRGSIPIFFIRVSKVVRLRPKRAAAPFGPPTRPLVSFRIRTILSCSSKLPAFRATEERGWEIHLTGSRDRFEIASLQSSGPGHDWSRRLAEHPLSSSACFPDARILPPAKRAGVWVEVPAGYHRLHPETACLDRPVPAGRFSARPHP